MTSPRKFGPITSAIFRWALRRYVGRRPKYSAAYLRNAARGAGALGCVEMQRLLATQARTAEMYERLDP